MFLTDDELFDLTKKRQRAKQVAVIRAIRPVVSMWVRKDDGRPMVPRSQFELGPAARKREPDLSHLEAV
jgi:hypothetical protein